MSTLNADEIQGDIAPGFRRSYHPEFHQAFIPLRMTDPAAARGSLRRLLGRITWSSDLTGRSRRSGGTGTRTDGQPDVNIAFTSTGLRQLEPELGDGMDDALDEGLARRTSRFRLLGAPDEWVIGRDDQRIDALLNVGSTEPLDGRVAGLIGAGFEEVRNTNGRRFIGKALPGGIEHFGFRDGLSQPRFALPAKPGKAAQGPPDQGRQRASRRHATYLDVPALSTYGDPSTPVQSAPRPKPVTFLASDPRLPASQFIVDEDSFWGNGSFMVWLRLRQRVDAFRHACEMVARRLSLEWGQRVLEHEAAGLLVGRWPNGTSLALMGMFDHNEFSYRQDSRFRADPLGLRCPLAAHSRKMNPRTTGDRARLILRRGITYGAPGADGADRGLLFVAYQASIERQFEVLQRVWAHEGQFPERFGSADPIMGVAAAPMSIEIPNPNGRGSVGIRLRNDWVVPTGGLYLFVPSRRAIEVLAAG